MEPCVEAAGLGFPIKSPGGKIREIDLSNGSILCERRDPFVWLISPAVLFSEQTSHQQSASSTFLSEQISTSHQPPDKRTGWR
jgi:hypothetical protein